MTISGKCFGVFLGFILFSRPLQAENFYSKTSSCPRGTTQVIELVAEVNLDLLPHYQPDQGGSSTCAIHAAMILANSIYKLGESKKAESPNQDLSFLDGMFRFGKTEVDEEEEECSLPFIDSTTSFLIKLRRNPKLFLDSRPITITSAVAGNDALLEQIEKCQSARCGAKRARNSKPHSACLSKICKKSFLKNLSHQIEDWDQISKSIDPEFPIQTLLHHSQPTEVEIPPFQLKTWDRFSSHRELSEDLVRQFVGQSPVLPLALATRVDSEDPVGHAVVLHRLERVDCVDSNHSIKRTGYQATLINSWGRGREKNGPFDLEKLVQGMVLEGQGFTQILPCDPTQQDCSRPIIEHSKSVPLLHYAEANDANQVKALLLRKEIKPNLAIASGMTPLIQAAVDGHDLVVAALLERSDTDPNQSLEGGATALYFAAQEGHLEIVKALMNRPEINPNRAWEGKTPLYVAALFEQTEIVRELLRSPQVIRTPHPDFFKKMESDPQVQEGYQKAPQFVEEIAKELEESKSSQGPKGKKRRTKGP